MRSNLRVYAVLILVVGVVVFASSATALPKRCSLCDCNSGCGQLCSIGSWISTCGEESICRDYCFSEPTQSDLEVLQQEIFGQASCTATETAGEEPAPAAESTR